MPTDAPSNYLEDLMAKHRREDDARAERNRADFFAGNGRFAWYVGDNGIPDLEFPPPLCPICDMDTYHDSDGFRCDRCSVYWHTNGTDGTPDDVEQLVIDALMIIWWGHAD